MEEKQRIPPKMESALIDGELEKISQAIAQSETISDTEFKKLQDKKAKTKTERHQERKALLKERYGIDVAPGLVEKDDRGW